MSGMNMYVCMYVCTKSYVSKRCVFGCFATTQHHGFTIGTDDMLRQPPYCSLLYSSTELLLLLYFDSNGVTDIVRLFYYQFQKFSI